MVLSIETATLISLAGSLSLGIFGAWLMACWGARFGLLDQPVSRSSHCTPIPRGGGVGVLLAVCFSALALQISIALWLPAFLLGVVSFFDDKHGLPPLFRLLLQLLAALCVLPLLAHPGSWPIWLLCSLFWVVFLVGTANFYNFMDGINGMAAITGIIGFGLISLFVHLTQGDTRIGMYSSCIALACLGFLPFNWPRPRVFLGDVGSILLGFIFAVLIAKLARTAFELLVLTGCLLPFYSDTLVTLWLRWRRGEDLLKAHRQHLYQILVHSKGFSHWQISSLYGFVQLFMGMFLIWQYLFGNQWVATAGVLVFLSIFVFISFKIRQEDCE